MIVLIPQLVLYKFLKPLKIIFYLYFRRHLYLFPNRLEIGIDSEPHVWPLEEIIGIQETLHRSYRCIQIRLVYFIILSMRGLTYCAK